MRPRLVRKLALRSWQYFFFAIANPLWIPMFVLGRFVAVRRLVSRRSVSSLSACPPSPVLERFDADAILSGLNQTGFYGGFRLRPEVQQEILEFAGTAICYGNGDRSRAFVLDRKDLAESGAGASFVIGDFMEGIDQCPAIHSLQNDPALRTLAAAYLNVEPVLVRSRLWWSFQSDTLPTESLKPFAQESFHYDIDDWACLKYFFYIVEVGPGNGAHVYVLNSHVRRPLSHQLSLFKTQTHANIQRTYGRENIRNVFGAAGYGFAEDPFGFHTGSRVVGGRRLVLEIEYGRSAQPLIFRNGVSR